MGEKITVESVVKLLVAPLGINICSGSHGSGIWRGGTVPAVPLASCTWRVTVRGCRRLGVLGE